MKKLLFFFILLGFGCSSNKEDVEGIEFMAYNWDLVYPSPSKPGKFYIQPKLYSILSLNGENRTYRCESFPNKEETYFSSVVDIKIINELLKELNVAKDKTEIPLSSYAQGGCVEGLPTLRLNVVYNNGTIKSYLFNHDSEMKKDSSIKKLYKALVLNYVKESLREIKDTVFVNKKKQAFIDFSMQQDTLMLPLPAIPKYNSVRFIK
jgi:hypothetical protein